MSKKAIEILHESIRELNEYGMDSDTFMPLHRCQDLLKEAIDLLEAKPPLPSRGERCGVCNGERGYESSHDGIWRRCDTCQGEGITTWMNKN